MPTKTAVKQVSVLDNHGGGKRWYQTGPSIANHHSANSPNATRQSLAISCCGCGSRDIFSNIALGYTAPTRKTAATNSGMSCLRFIWTGAARSNAGSVHRIKHKNTDQRDKSERHKRGQ